MLLRALSELSALHYRIKPMPFAMLQVNMDFRSWRLASLSHTEVVPKN